MPEESSDFSMNREREVLTETRTPKQRKILREIKQPVKVKESDFVGSSFAKSNGT